MDFTNTGQIGDTIGGIISPFVAIVAAFLTFFAFWVQYKANQQQRQDIELERFESNLFQLMNIHETITNGLAFTPSDGADRYFGQTFNGRQVFDILYNKLGWGDSWGIKSMIQKRGYSAYEDNKDINILDHYFRHLYNIFKYIHQTDILTVKDKYRYTCLVRAQLSQFELVLLYYNCLTTNGKDKFKPLIETYAILNNLRPNLLATSEEITYYTQLINNDNKSLGSDKKFDITYNRSAFVYNKKAK